MNTRIKLSVALVGIGIMLAFIPFNASTTFQLQADELLELSNSPEMYVTVDQVARFVNNEDSTIQLIDLRSADEFTSCNIPGSLNIPFANLLDKEWQNVLYEPETKIIFYSNGDQYSNMARTIVCGLGNTNSFVMKGGLNEWFKTVMLSKFEGDKISPRENVLFENRFKARKTFTQINSLPDSLKLQYFAARRVKEMQLDGGCE